MSWLIYITGLPGSGKSTIARALLKLLSSRGIEAAYLRLDEIRKEIIPEPQYTEEEREKVYRSYAERGLELFRAGKNVILDATAHRRKWRDLLRDKVDNFLEVHIKCDLETCIKRESERKEGLVMAGLYEKALERKRTGKDFPGLGEVIGVDIPYEESKEADIVIESDKLTPEEAAQEILIKIPRAQPLY
jgi:adenylylsulfate kinase-like enzyme